MCEPKNANRQDGIVDHELSDISATSAESQQHHESRPQVFTSTLVEVLFVYVVTMAVAMSSLTTGVVTILTSHVQKALSMSTVELAWLPSSANLASGAFLLFFGRTADLFGRRICFVVSMDLFAVFSLAAGFSQSPLQLNIFNGLMGILSAAAIPAGQGMLGEIYEVPSRRKNKVFAVFSAGNPLGVVFRSLFSAIALQLFNWRAPFFLLTFIYSLSLVVALLTVPVSKGLERKLSTEAFKTLDIGGALLTISGIGILSASLSLGADAPDGWKTPYILVMLILGLVLVISFVFWEKRQQSPLVPMGVWKSRNFSISVSIVFLGFTAFAFMNFWVSLFMQKVEKFSPIMVAVHLLPMTLGGILINTFAGFFMHQVSNTRLMIAGALCYTIAFLLMGVRKRDDSYWAFYFPGLLLGVVGADFEFYVVNMYVVSYFKKDEQSTASGILQTITRLGITIGMGISTVIFEAIESDPASRGYFADDAAEPYSVTLLFCAELAALSVPLSFQLTLRTQGR